MTDMTRAEMTELADDYEKCAARSDRNAASGDRDAADQSIPQQIRDCAALTAVNARANAAQYRADAALLRDGINPHTDR